MRSFLVALRYALAATAVVATPLSAQQYPTKPVKIIVTHPPGGGPDLTARIVGEKIAPLLGRPVVVENRPGSNGNIAAELVARSPADGHTLLIGAEALTTINPHIYRHMPIDVQRDLAPVASLASIVFVLSVNPSVPVRTFPEFVEYARKASPPLHYASAGNGSPHQFMMEALKQRAGIELVHVPYKGGAQATTGTVAGEVAAIFTGASSAPQIRAGRLRPLAVSSPKRSQLFPDLPAIADFYSGYDMTNWNGLFAPAGTPEPVLARLRAEVAKALAADDVREKLSKAGGLQPLVTSTAEFVALIKSDYDRHGKLVRDLGVKVD